jgi:hypothetical protein
LFLLSEVFVYVNLQYLYLTTCEARLIDGRKHHSREHRMAENGYYRDFRAHLQGLEQHGKLIRITREINKDTELMPLVRWQFRGLEEAERKAFIFEKVIDSRSRRYAMPVTVGTLAATTEIYAIGMMCARASDCHPRAGSGSNLAGTGFTEWTWPRHDSRADFHAGV